MSDKSRRVVKPLPMLGLILEKRHSYQELYRLPRLQGEVWISFPRRYGSIFTYGWS